MATDVSNRYKAEKSKVILQYTPLSLLKWEALAEQLLIGNSLLCFLTSGRKLQNIPLSSHMCSKGLNVCNVRSLTFTYFVLFFFILLPIFDQYLYPNIAVSLLFYARLYT
jgi:hypothetical protein